MTNAPAPLGSTEGIRTVGTLPVTSLELGVPDRAAMQIMGWSNAALTQRYQHVTGHVLGSVAAQVGAHLWETPHVD